MTTAPTLDSRPWRFHLVRLALGSWLVVFVTTLLHGVTVVNGMVHAAIFIGGASLACEAQHALSRKSYDLSSFLMATVAGSVCSSVPDGSSILVGALFAPALVTFYCAVGLLMRWTACYRLFWHYLRNLRSMDRGPLLTIGPTTETGLKLSRDEFIGEMRGKTAEVLGAVADAINDGPAGQIDSYIEETIGELFTELREQAIARALQMRVEVGGDFRDEENRNKHWGGRRT